MNRKITFLTLFLWLMTVTVPVIGQQKAAQQNHLTDMPLGTKTPVSVRILGHYEFGTLKNS